METIAAAIITAAASIIVAIIQAQSAARQAALLRQRSDTTTDIAPLAPALDVDPETVPQEPVERPSASKSLSASEIVLDASGLKAWLLVTAALIAVAIVAPHVLESISYINVLLIPLATIILVIWRPIAWGWAAALVALLHGSNYFGYYWRGGTFGDDDLQFALGFYIGNALLVAVVAFLRLRTSQREAI